jgi:hypothetical protein
MAIATITTQPTTASAVGGATLTLGTITWTGIPGNASTISWYKDGQLVSFPVPPCIITKGSGSIGPGFGSINVKITNCEVKDAGSYVLRIENTAPDVGHVDSAPIVATVTDGDCVDARIDRNMINTLKSIAVYNGYNTEIGTVERPRKTLSINGRYPYTLMIQMEPDDVDQWANLRDDCLNYIIWFLDGKSDDNETANGEFMYRLRNVAADITKALMVDPTRGGLAQNTKCVRNGFGFFMEPPNVMEPGAYVLIEIERVLNPNNPYNFIP